MCVLRSNISEVKGQAHNTDNKVALEKSSLQGAKYRCISKDNPFHPNLNFPMECLQSLAAKGSAFLAGVGIVLVFYCVAHSLACRSRVREGMIRTSAFLIVAL